MRLKLFDEEDDRNGENRPRRALSPPSVITANNHHIRMVAEKATEGISCLVDGHPKTCVATIAIISGAGEKLSH
jgi:hypothetical protein